MTSNMLLSLALFAFVSSITPGPNNVMLTAAGANFGYRKSLPHMLGITVGAALMLLLVGLGLGQLFETVPVLCGVLKYLGAAYLAYLAVRLARAGGVDGEGAAARPFRFWEAAAFQWVNPKAWIMAIGIVAAYLPQERDVHHLLLATLLLAVVNFPCISVWTLSGGVMRRMLTRKTAIQRFNLAMAALLLASLYPLVAEQLALF